MTWHGTLGGYGNHQCRCDRCRAAHTVYRRARRHKDLAEKTERERMDRIAARMANPTPEPCTPPNYRTVIVGGYVYDVMWDGNVQR